MQQWEYMTVYLVARDTEIEGKTVTRIVMPMKDEEVKMNDVLERAGKRGWELASIQTEWSVQHHYDDGDVHIEGKSWSYIFKRPIEQKQEEPLTSQVDT